MKTNCTCVLSVLCLVLSAIALITDASPIQCQPGTYVSNPSSGRVCSPCPSGQFSTITNAATCTNVRSCAPGQYVAKAPSATSNRLCMSCIDGKYSDTINAVTCLTFKTCPTGLKQLKRPTHSSDRVCEVPPVITYAAATTASGSTSCAPFGATSFGNIVFTYRNIAPFTVKAGDKISFDSVGLVNNVNVCRSIYFAVSATPFTTCANVADVVTTTAAGWTKVVNLGCGGFGNTVVGDFDLEYVIDAPYSFEGGNLLIATDVTGAVTDGTCTWNTRDVACSDAPDSYFVSRQMIGLAPITNSITVNNESFNLKRFIGEFRLTRV